MEYWSIDGFTKSLPTVTPAKAGVQNSSVFLDSGFRRNDRKGEFPSFCESISIGWYHYSITPALQYSRRARFVAKVLHWEAPIR